jgi:hypothetical protein
VIPYSNGTLGRDNAELVAFEILDPALRSLGGIPEEASSHYNDQRFHSAMSEIFSGSPTGRFSLPDVNTLLEQVLVRLSTLEQQVEKTSKSEIHS